MNSVILINYNHAQRHQLRSLRELEFILADQHWVLLLHGVRKASLHGAAVTADIKALAMHISGEEIMMQGRSISVSRAHLRKGHVLG